MVKRLAHGIVEAFAQKSRERTSQQLSLRFLGLALNWHLVRIAARSVSLAALRSSR